MIYQIAVEMPAWIKAGLDSGAYELVGSVVREVGSKNVVAWLRDTGEASAQTTTVPPTSMPDLGVAVGLQVLNTAVTVAGFAMLAEKMSAISRQCDSILDRIAKADQHLQWLRDAGMATVQSKMLAALEGAHTANRLGQSVLPYDTAINESALFFRRMLNDMMRRGDMLRDAEMFRLLVVQHAVAVVARARSHWLLLGPEDGLRALEQGLQAHADVVAGFQRPLRAPRENAAEVLAMTGDQRVMVKDIAGLLRLVSLRLTDKREELVSCVSTGLVAPADADTIRRLESKPVAWLVIDQDAIAVPVSAEPA